MSGRLRPSLLVRVERLEEWDDAAEESLRGLSPYDRTWHEAWKSASDEELAMLEAACERAQREGRSDLDPEHDPEEYALLEELLLRVSPTLASDVRVSRCLLWQALYRAEKEAKAAERAWTSKGYATASEYAHAAAEERRRLLRRAQTLATAEINRSHAVSSGLEPVTDPAEAERLLAEVLAALDAPDSTDRVLRLVGRSQ